MIRLLLPILFLFGCTSTLNKSGDHDVTIFAVEGLGYGDFITTGLIEPLKKDHKFNFIRIAWGSECPKKFPDGKLIAVGHSLGGPRVLECVKESKRQWKTVVTLDARVLGQPYSAPKNSEVTFNFYQKSLIFPGYPVDGSIQQQVYVGHTDIPSLPEVHKVIIEAIRSPM